MMQNTMVFINQLIEKYGYAAVFIILVLWLFPLPIPDGMMILLVGYFTKIGLLHYHFSLLTVFSGSIIGMLISYGSGKRIGFRCLIGLVNGWS